MELQKHSVSPSQNPSVRRLLLTHPQPHRAPVPQRQLTDILTLPREEVTWSVGRNIYHS